MKGAAHMLAVGALLLCTTGAFAQCTNHTISVTGGLYPFEVSWQLVNPGGTIVASGFAPATQVVCLPVGCYTMQMFDSFGDGWNNAVFTVNVQATGAVVASGTLNGGYSGTANVSIGGGCNTAGCTSYILQVTGGSYPSEISWSFNGASSVVASGFAPTTVPICIIPGCYSMQMFDSFGDGWNGATWGVYTTGGVLVQSGTLSTGSSGATVVAVGVPAANCGTTGGPVTASDCPQAVNVCTNINFSIDPNGAGAVNEIPPLGSLGNPDFMPLDGLFSPWGTDNWGCLRNDELNSTWMVINIQSGGSLQFTFGGLGTQAGYYDWIMYPFNSTTCAQISGNSVPPIRCNWNGVSFGGTGLAAPPPAGGDATNFEPPLNVATGDRYIICFSNWSSVTTSVPLVFGGTAVVSCTPVILPVELVAFEATTTTNGVDLTWSTATELAASHFDVERSVDLVHWERRTSMPAAGTSLTTTQYRWTDASPVQGDSYYRLAMHDLDGTVAYSETRHVKWDTAALLCYPNPNTGAFSLASVEDPAHIEVRDALGRAVPFTLSGTNAPWAVRLLGAPAGLYSVRAGNGSEGVATSTFLVVDELP